MRCFSTETGRSGGEAAAGGLTERVEMVSAADGRRLEVFIAGADAGPLVVSHGGTPSSGRTFPPLLETARERGLRHVGYARPGYSESDRSEGRTVADCVADTAAIADHLGADHFHTLGGSGGGPHALACAALLPERVISAATIAGAAPREAEGLDWYAGMADENVEEFGLAERGAAALEPWLERETERMAGAQAEEVADALGSLISVVDREALNGDLAEFFTSSFPRAVKRGVFGWLDDDLAFVRRWGFDLSRIEVPVTIWHGAQDRFVPFEHGRWLADHVAGARPRLLADDGHLSLSIAHYGDVLGDLVERR
jgi:pimeloyl-ACP methyl ester carboxylesterase